MRAQVPHGSFQLAPLNTQPRPLAVTPHSHAVTLRHPSYTSSGITRPFSQCALSQVPWRKQQWGHSQHRSALLPPVDSAISGSSAACRDPAFHPGGPGLRLPSPRYSLLQGPVSGSVLTGPWRPGFQPVKSGKRDVTRERGLCPTRLPPPRTAARELSDSVGARTVTLFGKPAR